jgi:hypothetical protein
VGMGRRNCLLRLFMFTFRMDDECILSCPLNYENTSVKTSKGYICTVKQCEDRTPWSNGSCSMTEDFPVGDGGVVMECYMWRGKVADGDGMESCVVKSGCPSDYPGVCCLCFNFNFLVRFCVVVM